MENIIHFTRYYYEDQTGEKNTYENLYLKDTKENRDLLKKIDTFIKHYADEGFTMTHQDWTYTDEDSDFGEFLNFMIMDLEETDIKIKEVEYEW